MTLIRKMRTQDVPIVYKQGKAEPRFSVGGEKGFWTEEQLYSWVRSERDVLLVAEDEDKIVGFMMSAFHEPTGKALLENLRVNPEYHGRGIGIRLIKESLERLKEKGARYYVNLVEPDNRGVIGLFENLGFQRGKPMLWMDKVD